MENGVAIHTQMAKATNFMYLCRMASDANTDGDEKQFDHFVDKAKHDEFHQGEQHAVNLNGLNLSGMNFGYHLGLKLSHTPMHGVMRDKNRDVYEIQGYHTNRGGKA